MQSVYRLLIGMSPPNTVSGDFIMISDNHQATKDHPNALGDILKRPEWLLNSFKLN